LTICEQRPLLGKKGIMDREVVEVITPGTAVEDDYLEQNSNNYLVDICVIKNRLCFAYLDVSTGEFKAFSVEKNEETYAEALRTELYRLAARELLVQQSILDQPECFQAIHESSALVEPQPDWVYDIHHGSEVLKEKFGISSLKGFGFSDDAPELAAAGNLLEYVQE